MLAAVADPATRAGEVTLWALVADAVDDDPSGNEVAVGAAPASQAVDS